MFKNISSYFNTHNNLIKNCSIFRKWFFLKIKDNCTFFLPFII